MSDRRNGFNKHKTDEGILNASRALRLFLTKAEPGDDLDQLIIIFFYAHTDDQGTILSKQLILNLLYGFQQINCEVIQDIDPIIFVTDALMELAGIHSNQQNNYLLTS